MSNSELDVKQMMTSTLQDSLRQYANQHEPKHIKNIFFTELADLIAKNQLTVSCLTQKLADLKSKRRRELFYSVIETSEAEEWIETLYRLMGIKLSPEILQMLVQQKPSKQLKSYLDNARYHLWKNAPFNETSITFLGHELKGVLELNTEKTKGSSLAKVLLEHWEEGSYESMSDDLLQLLARAPAYVPQLLDQLYRNIQPKEQEKFVRHLLNTLKLDPTGKILAALLHSNLEIVKQLVIVKPEMYFKASESIRIVMNNILQKAKENDTLDKIAKSAASVVSTGDPALKAERMNALVDGSFRFKKIRLSQTEQALVAIEKYLSLQPGEYKQAFFRDLAQGIQTNGLTVAILQEYLTHANNEELFAKWGGLNHSRAAQVMANLYTLASSAVLNRDELKQMAYDKLLPRDPHPPEELPGDSKLMTWLQDSVAMEIKSEAPQLIALDQKENALRVIQNYLDQQPGAYKHQFFSDLALEIDRVTDVSEKDWFLNLLKNKLKKADNKELFSKWSGLTHSRAAAVMASLYNIASLGGGLSSIQFNKMANEKELPDQVNDNTLLIQGKIREIVMNPDRDKSSHLALKIGSAFKEMQAKAQFLQNSQHHNSRAVESEYQKKLITKGMEKASKQEHPAFDLQGHVLVFVKLKEVDYQAILDNIKQKKIGSNSAEQTVKLLLGSELTSHTLCNLDIKGNETLEAKFKTWIGRDDVPQSLMDSKDRASIIDLQEEMSLHVLLALRVLENKLSFKFNHELRTKLLSDVNKLVQNKVKTILELAHFKAEELNNFENLNTSLDKARKELAVGCRTVLVDSICNQYPTLKLEHVLDKHDFTSTTATGMDYLRSDARNQTVVRISGTKNTAHDKALGASKQALRFLHRNHYKNEADQGLSVTPYNEKTLEARVPSIAVKESSESEGTKDVANKLQESHRLLRTQAAYSNGPMIYNLLTSLHTLAYDNSPFERSNKQRLSAEYILQGSHLYNLRQKRIGEPDELVYVQNIPVNQHSGELDDSAFDDVTKEATIMTDMALLSTLNHYAGVFDCALRESITQSYSYAHKQYLSFLPEVEKDDKYFHNTDFGYSVKTHLINKKSQWNSVKITSPDSDNLNTLVVKALFKMYSSNDYRDKQFGMLAQSLSVFVEPMSQAGCKSANERYQGVSGRVELLKSISSRSDDQLSAEEMYVKMALRNFVEGKGTASCAEVQRCLDQAYNKHNLYGAATVFSKEDQGAASKVEATKNKAHPGIIDEIDTNVAETGFLTRLHQSHCSSMQAHKANLAEVYKTLFLEKGEDNHTNRFLP